MLFKLSVKNLKKSIMDYTIYFATLVLGVAIFYVFNAMGSQSVLLKVSESTAFIIKLMNEALSIVSVFVSFVLGFLIVYASNFMMKRRKKEFAVYLLLGMGKARVARIIVIETLCIGVISLVAGLGVGILASQGMSVVVANMFEADMTQFRFLVSSEAIWKTLLYFACIFIIVLVFDTFLVGKEKLINLITASGKQEKNIAKNPLVCLIVFVVGAVLLGTAYYHVTAEIEKIVKPSDMGIEIVKGIIGTVLVFWSISGLMLFVVGRNKNFYFKNLRSFTIKELGSKINTTVISGSIICLMLFVTICILSSAMSVKKNINDNLKSMVPVDVQFHRWKSQDIENEDISEVLKRAGVDTSVFKDVIEVSLYESDTVNEEEALCLIDVVGKENFEKSMFVKSGDGSVIAKMYERIIRLSDYNKIAKLFGNPVYKLEEDEYIIGANYEQFVDVYNVALKDGNTITVGDKTYHPKYNKCQEVFVEISEGHTNEGFIILPDSVDLSGFREYISLYTANYNVDTKQEREKLEDFIDGKEFRKQINYEREKNDEIPEIYINSKSGIYDNSIGLTAMVVFIGTYLGIIFVISGAAILALKELSQMADNRNKYEVLRKLGVDDRMITHSVFAQNAIFFGIPLILAIIHSIFGIQTCQYILEVIGNGGLLYSIIMTAMLLIAVYGIYFLLTFHCCKRIVSD